MMVTILVDIFQLLPRPVLWCVVIVLIPFAVAADIFYYIRSKGWLWLVGAFVVGFSIAFLVLGASQDTPGAIIPATKQSLFFRLMQKTIGRDAVWMIISGIRLWKNVLQSGANFFLWWVWLLQKIERTLLY